MPDKDASTPRVFFARHGETAWTLLGRYTSTTNLALTPPGRAQVSASALMLVGAGKLIDPCRLSRVLVSPRLRALETAGVLLDGTELEDAVKKVGSFAGTEEGMSGMDNQVVKVDERLREWTYGLYEGKTTAEIRGERQGRGLDGQSAWDIWRDGCEEGESALQVATRIDALIADIRTLQSPHMHSEKGACDVLLVAHGHLLRAFVKRWLNFPLNTELGMMLEPGAVGVLSYQHHNAEEPALLVGVGFSS